MHIRNLCAVAILCGGIATAGAARADVQVNRWPADVPCDVLSKNEDGTYTLLTAVTLSNGEVIPSGTTFPTLDEYQVWVSKCGP